MDDPWLRGEQDLAYAKSLAEDARKTEVKMEALRAAEALQHLQRQLQAEKADPEKVRAKRLAALNKK